MMGAGETAPDSHASRVGEHVHGKAKNQQAGEDTAQRGVPAQAKCFHKNPFLKIYGEGKPPGVTIL